MIEKTNMKELKKDFIKNEAESLRLPSESEN